MHNFDNKKDPDVQGLIRMHTLYHHHYFTSTWMPLVLFVCAGAPPALAAALS